MNKIDNYSRMLVAMDLSDMDKDVVRYAGLVAKTFEVDAVYFLHVTTSMELPEEIMEKYGDVMAPVDETLEKEMQATIKEQFPSIEGCAAKVQVKAGSVTDELLKYAKVKMVDLIVLGRKHKLTGTGLHSSKVAKGTSASVLFVPENPTMSFEKILVPIDYSKYAEMAFSLALDIKDHVSSRVLSNHVYRVPKGYYKSGKSYEEFAEIMLENTKTECAKFFKKLDVDTSSFEHTFALDDDPHPADKIYRTAVEEKVDLIMLGSKGRSSAAAFLIGSVAEKLLHEDHDIPLFLVQKGNENVSLLEALFKI